MYKIRLSLFCCWVVSLFCVFIGSMFAARATRQLDVYFFRVHLAYYYIYLWWIGCWALIVQTNMIKTNANVFHLDQFKNRTITISHIDASVISNMHDTIPSTSSHFHSIFNIFAYEHLINSLHLSTYDQNIIVIIFIVCVCVVFLSGTFIFKHVFCEHSVLSLLWHNNRMIMLRNTLKRQSKLNLMKDDKYCLMFITKLYNAIT